MRQTSALYQRLLRDPLARKEVKLRIAGEDYGEDRLISLHTFGGMFAGGPMTAGGAVAGEIEVVLRNWGDIPRMAELVPFVRLTNGAQHSEWLQKGVYFIDTRTEDLTLTLHGFDGMLKGEAEWVPVQDLEFPMPMDEAAAELARLMGTTVDPRSQISHGYTIDYPANGYTRRDILRFIAAAHGGNFVMNDLGQLRLLRLGGLPAETHYLVDEYGDPLVFGGDRILVG